LELKADNLTALQTMQVDIPLPYNQEEVALLLKNLLCNTYTMNTEWVEIYGLPVTSF